MADRDLWVVVAVETAVEWPQGAEVTASFRRRQMILRPETSALWADVSLLRLPDEEEFTAMTLVHRFISAVAWKRRAAIRVMGHVGGTHRIRVGGRREPFGAATMLPGFDFDGLAEAPTREQELALALYREAIGIPENTYRFLALFRILNISLSTPSAQIQWIEDQLATLDYPARPRAEELARQVIPEYANVGGYLYAAGRNALAHAFTAPFVDPDLVDDTYRINRDLIVVEALVERYMTRVLHLPDR
jgi:hypothetical protein